MKQKKTKRTYRLRNWSDYNKALVNRGSLSIRVSEDVLAAWHNTARTLKRGKPATYADTAILCMATLMEVYHLPLRGAEGLLRSILRLLAVEDLAAPDYSTLCRRRPKLEVTLPRLRKSAPLHLVVDSTGVKVYGEGEWKVRRHGVSKRRRWRKLHLGVDPATHEIVASLVSTNARSDGQCLPELLEQVADELEQVSGDGGDDKPHCYDAIRERGARSAIPPRKNALIWQHGNTKAQRHSRDENLRAIRRTGRAAWKAGSGYHRRSLAETAVFRIKTIFSDRVSARTFDAQAAQVLVRCAALNRMTHLGMPQSYTV